MRVLSVVGNRPQFIKSGPLSLALKGRVEEVVLHTGQHYDRSSPASSSTSSASTPPAYQPRRRARASHAEQTARMLPGIERAIARREAGLGARLRRHELDARRRRSPPRSSGRPVAHVEAGLRSFDRSMPEELNRILVDRLSTPPPVSQRGRSPEPRGRGDRRESVHVVGDVMLDANLEFAPLARGRARRRSAGEASSPAATCC